MRSAAPSAATATTPPGAAATPAARPWRRRRPSRRARRSRSSPPSRTATRSTAAPWSANTPPTARRPCASTAASSPWTPPQNWTGYDYLKADVYTDAKGPLELYVEVRDRQTRDYWTRVNYTTVVPPGASTLIIPTALYVGEKSRPGPAAAAGRRHPARLLRRRQAAGAAVHRQPPPGARHGDGEGAVRRPVGLRRRPGGQPGHGGLHAARPRQDLHQGPRLRLEGRPLLAGLRRPAARPALPDFICVEQGGLAIDVPNGKYHVFVNMDSPSGFWGEFQRYRKRALILEGERHEDTMDLESFKKRYFRHWDTDDLPADNTFDKYQVPYFQREAARGRGPRRPAEHRLRGRELGLLRLGDRGLSRREGGRGQALPRLRQGAPALPLRQRLQARAAAADRRGAAADRRPSRSAASSPSTATG